MFVRRFDLLTMEQGSKVSPVAETVHGHHHPVPESGWWLGATMALNLFIFLAELVGGLLAGSLALIADSFHNLTDLTSLVLVVVARRLQRLPASDQHTFGFRRADVMAGFVNAAILFAAMGAVLTEAVDHLLHPHPVNGWIMLVIGAIGLLANTLGVGLLRRDPNQDLGLKSAALHLVTDAASSAAVVLGGGLLLTVGWLRVDPALGILIALVAMFGAVRMMREGIHILMEGTPRSLEAEEVRGAIEGVEGVCAVEHFHLWSLASTEPSLSATVCVTDQRVSEAERVLRRVEKLVSESFGIHHTVLELAVERGSEGAVDPRGS